VNNTATAGDAIAGNTRLTLAASIVLGPSPGSGTCAPANGIVDAGYNIDIRKATSCEKTSYVDARGTSTWSLKLPSGRYTIWTRAIDVAGNVEHKSRARNLRSLRIPWAKS
jgi:hypothetical protein